MNGTINFLFESGISLTIFSIIYVLFLRKETFFRMNRLFLLGAVLFSVILPLLKFRVFEQQSVLLPEITVTPYRNLLESVTIYGQDLSASVENAVLSVRMLIWIYLAGVFLLLINYLIRLIRIVILIQKNQVIKSGRFSLVILENECSPFSFYNHVFVSRQLRNMEGYDRMIRHEEEHIKQGHSFDILIIELLTVFQWFNPFIWMLGHAIRENHEYLADRAVLESGTDRGYYKKLLLSQIAGGQLALTNNFNYSLIKNRFKMMSKIKSSKIANIKVILGVLAATAMIIVFACEHKEKSQSLDTTINTIVPKDKSDATQNKTNQYNKIPEGEDIFFIVEKMPEFPGGEAALRQFIANNIIYPELAKDNGLQGKVYVTFVVSKDGSVANTEIARGVDPLLDKEALRVVNTLPAWSPGYQSGMPVNVKYTVPINFVLDKENKIPEGEDIFFIVEKMPKFPGGETALRQFIANNIIYPELAKDNGIQGKVYVTFVVTKDGSVANAEIARGVDPLLDKEALRIVNTLPAWSPGYQRGKPVNVKYTVPINFVLDGDKAENKKNTGLMSPQGKDANGVEKVKVITYFPSTSADARDKLNTINEEAIKPLFIVDGITVSSIDNLNPEDIQGIQILKKESAIKMYGEKGRNGVVIITTKNHDIIITTVLSKNHKQQSKS